MKHKAFIEQAKEEFNPDGNNDSILEKYVLALVKTMNNSSLDIERENKKWDKKINDWLAQKLTQAVENYQEEQKKKVEKEYTVLGNGCLIKHSELKEGATFSGNQVTIRSLEEIIEKNKEYFL